FRYAYIVESKYQLESMKKELAKIEETNQSLKIQLSKLKSLDRIESVARTELGMIEPNLDSIIFIKSPDFSLAMQNERKQEKTTREADYGALSVMNKINAIMNIFN
ncbi:MAG TPA: hypothetical protein GX526_05110, partial [Thermoanaerobacterales bacterium]|nr:hypothetical protein [Thermoanaerobacterales bacterium]